MGPQVGFLRPSACSLRHPGWSVLCCGHDPSTVSSKARSWRIWMRFSQAAYRATCNPCDLVVRSNSAIRRIRRSSLPVRLILGALSLAAPFFAPSAGAQTFGCTPAMANDIVCETSKTGNPPNQWDISGSGDSTIQGFATDISVNQGGTVQFKIKSSASAYSIEIYRMGYYIGNCARRITTISPSAP